MLPQLQQGVEILNRTCAVKAEANPTGLRKLMCVHRITEYIRTRNLHRTSRITPAILFCFHYSLRKLFVHLYLSMETARQHLYCLEYIILFTSNKMVQNTWRGHSEQMTMLSGTLNQERILSAMQIPGQLTARDERTDLYTQAVTCFLDIGDCLVSQKQFAQFSILGGRVPIALPAMSSNAHLRFHPILKYKSK